MNTLPGVQDKEELTQELQLQFEETKGGRGKQVQRPRDKCFQGITSTWLCEELGVIGEKR